MPSATARERESAARGSPHPPRPKAPGRTTAGRVRIVVRRAGGVELLPLSEVECLEADGNVVVVHTASGAQHRIRESLSHMHEQLLEHGFIRVHRGTVVNATSIVAIEKGRYRKAFCLLRNGSRHEIGRVEFHRLRALWQTGVLDLATLATGLTLLPPL